MSPSFLGLSARRWATVVAALGVCGARSAFAQEAEASSEPDPTVIVAAPPVNVPGSESPSRTGLRRLVLTGRAAEARTEILTRLTTDILAAERAALVELLWMADQWAGTGCPAAVHAASSVAGTW